MKRLLLGFGRVSALIASLACIIAIVAALAGPAFAADAAASKPSADGRPPLAVAPFDAATAKKRQAEWARYMRQPVDVTNSIGMKLKLVPPGEFQMGTAASPTTIGPVWPYEAKSHHDERPQHLVAITRPFYLGVYHVTRGQFKQFVADSSYKTEAETNGKGGWGYDSQCVLVQKPEYNWRNPCFDQTDEHPVVNVSWNDAMAFCRWLGHKEGKEYRLPREAEWEFACRAGTTGENPNRWVGLEQWRKTAPIGSSPANPYSYANPFELSDMLDSTAEMCADWYAKDYYAASPRNDPQGPSSGTHRVLRGGASGEPGFRAADSAVRDRLPADACFSVVGIRVLRVCDPLNGKK